MRHLQSNSNTFDNRKLMALVTPKCFRHESIETADRRFQFLDAFKERE